MAFTRHLPTTNTGLAAELEQLAGAISRDGVAPHTNEIIRLGRQAEHRGLPAGAISALLDATSAPIVRERAAVQLSLAASSAPTTRTEGTPRSRVFDVPVSGALVRPGNLPLR